jgi:hypothetical protein
MGGVYMNKGRVGEDRGSKETDGCPLTLGDSEILQVLVVSPDLNGVLHAFKIVLPLIQILDGGKHLSIINLVFALDWIQCLGQECDRVPCIVVV